MANVGKHAVVYGMGVVLNKALAFLMLPLYTRVLTPADYGVMGLIDMTLDVVAIVAGSKMVHGVYRFYHKASGPAERGDVVSTALITLGVSYVVVSMLAFLAAGLLSDLVFGTPEHAGLIRIASGALAFQALLLVPLAYARVRDRSGLFVTANAIKLFLGASLNVLFLVVLGMGVAGVFLSALIMNMVVGTALTVWVLRQTGLRVSATALRDLVRYGVPLVAVQFATFVSTFGDRYFLQSAADETVVGVYHLAYKFAFLLVVLGFAPFAQVWEPKRFQIWERPDRDELLSRGFLYANVLLLTAAVAISLFVQPLLHVMSAPSFHGAAALVPLILVAYVLQSWGSLQNIGILIRERTEYVTLAEWIAAGVAILAYALLIPRYLAWGAAAATVLTFAVRFGLTYWFSQRLGRVEYRWGPIVRMSLLAAGVVIGAMLLPVSSFLTSLIVRTGFLIAYLLLLWNAPILPVEERERARRLASQAATMVRGAWDRKRRGEGIVGRRPSS